MGKTLQREEVDYFTACGGGTEVPQHSGSVIENEVSGGEMRDRRSELGLLGYVFVPNNWTVP